QEFRHLLRAVSSPTGSAASGVLRRNQVGGQVFRRRPVNPRRPQSSDSKNMSEFFIDKTEFGIDPEASSLKVVDRGDGKTLLTLEVEGEPDRYDDIRDAPNSPWEWADYPPRFALTSFPVALTGKQVVVRLTEEDCADHEVGIYMMEHNLVEDVVLKVS